MRIAVVGIGYVGLANAILLSQNHTVVAVDCDQNKVAAVNARRSPLADREIAEYLSGNDLDLTATANGPEAYRDADFVVIATPTDYDTMQNHFDTSSIEDVVRQVLRVNPDTTIVIKSTVPVGYTSALCMELGVENIMFSPEFLREGRALYDNLYPSRIVAGVPLEDQHLLAKARTFAELLAESAEKEDIPILVMTSSEAEAVKLFANTYLAMRVAFFNELDSYAEIHQLDSKRIIEGIGHDPRIGSFYNNPSFGYGGYCLPKDAKQLLANYRDVPNDLISAIVATNTTRKDFITKSILKKVGALDTIGLAGESVIGIYRLAMKTGADNFRQSSVLGIIERIQKCGAKVIIYEPALTGEYFMGCKLVGDFKTFADSSQIIVANRYNPELEPVKGKLYTRDIYFRD